MARYQWICLGCKAVDDARVPPALCPRCGSVDSYTEPEGRPQKLPAKVVHAPELRHSETCRRRTHDLELDGLLGGGFALGSWAGLWGRAGSGKSRLALRWLTHMGRTLWVSNEMPEDLVYLTATSAGAVLENLYIGTDIEPGELAAHCREHHCNFVGFDSISELSDGDGAELLEQMQFWSCGGPRFGIVICHETKDGQYRGPSTFGHAPDYLIRTAPEPPFAQVSIEKSRYCAVGSVLCELVVYDVNQNGNSRG